MERTRKVNGRTDGGLSTAKPNLTMQHFGKTATLYKKFPDHTLVITRQDVKGR